MTSAQPSFRCVQLDFGFELGPPDGSYMVRVPGEADPTHVLVLETLSAPLRGVRRGRRRSGSETSVGLSRATVIVSEPSPSEAEAEAWLSSLRGDAEGTRIAVAAAFAVVGRATRAQRLATGDATTREPSERDAVAVRIGFGDGDSVAAGQLAQAWQPARPGERTRRSMDAATERFAALLGGREQALVCEELVQRARRDLDGDDLRAAALQTRIALEAALAELSGRAGAARRDALQADRSGIAQAANAALHGTLEPADRDAVAGTIERIEAGLRAARLERW